MKQARPALIATLAGTGNGRSMSLTQNIQHARMIATRRSQADGDRSATARRAIMLLAAVLLVVAMFSLFQGASDASALAVIKSWLGLDGGYAVTTRDRVVIEAIRAPRMAMAMLVGAALAVAGAVMQGLFRNPLADPGIVGTTSGASLGAVSVIVLGETLFAPFTALLGSFALPVAAFIGALVVTLALYRIATNSGATSVAMLLLAGIAMAALANALTGLLIFMSDDQQLRDLNFWLLGSLAGATWVKVWTAGPIILAALLFMPSLAHGLNCIVLGEAAAGHMGVPVQRLKAVAVVLIAAIVGAAVAVSGGIGFVGVVVPHLLRLAIGPNHRYLLPAAALLGGSLLLLADIVSRTIVAPAELPLGIVTAIFGTPFFFWILLRRRALLGF